MSKPKTLAVFAVIVALLFALTNLGSAEAKKPFKPAQRAAVSGTYMVGDSTTQRVYEKLQARHPDWNIDGRGGTPIRALPSRLEFYLAENPAPRYFIQALGTNNSSDPDWTKARLVAAINKLPAETTVYLMLVVRAGDFQNDKDANLIEYNRFSRELSKERPNTFVINWRNTVLSDPTLNNRTGLSSLLEDGTHQTGSTFGTQTPGPGVDTYIRLIEEKVPA